MKLRYLLLILVPLIFADMVIAGTAVVGVQWKQDNTRVTTADDVTGVDVPVTIDIDGILTGFSSIDTFSHDGPVYFNLSSNESIIIDGSSHTRQVDVGVFRILHTAEIEGTRAVQVVINANGQSGTKGYNVDYTADGMKSRDTGEGIDVNFIPGTASGGRVHGLSVSQSGDGGLNSFAVNANPRVGAFSQVVGTPQNMDAAFKTITGTFINILADVNSAASDVDLFENQNDEAYFGNDEMYDELVIALQTVASGPGIVPDFAFSNGSTFSSFSPDDGSNGFKVSSNVNWMATDLTGWSTQTVNAVADKYWIRITRTKNVLATPPKEDTIQVTEGTIYTWDNSGDLNINSLTFTNTGGLPYGEISTFDNASTVVISGTGVANKVQFDGFDTNGLSYNTTPNHITDDITIDKAGVYQVNCSITAESTAGTAAKFAFQGYKNNGVTILQNLHAHRDLAGGTGDTGSVSVSGYVDFAVNDTFELWLWNDTNTQNIVVEDVTCSLHQIGG